MRVCWDCCPTLAGYRGYEERKQYVFSRSDTCINSVLFNSNVLWNYHFSSDSSTFSFFPGWWCKHNSTGIIIERDTRSAGWRSRLPWTCSPQYAIVAQSARRNGLKIRHGETLWVRIPSIALKTDKILHEAVGGTYILHAPRIWCNW